MVNERSMDNVTAGIEAAKRSPFDQVVSRVLDRIIPNIRPAERFPGKDDSVHTNLQNTNVPLSDNVFTPVSHMEDSYPWIHNASNVLYSVATTTELELPERVQYLRYTMLPTQADWLKFFNGTVSDSEHTREKLTPNLIFKNATDAEKKALLLGFLDQNVVVSTDELDIQNFLKDLHAVPATEFFKYCILNKDSINQLLQGIPVSLGIVKATATTGKTLDGTPYVTYSPEQQIGINALQKKYEDNGVPNGVFKKELIDLFQRIQDAGIDVKNITFEQLIVDEEPMNTLLPPGLLRGALINNIGNIQTQYTDATMATESEPDDESENNYSALKAIKAGFLGRNVDRFRQLEHATHSAHELQSQLKAAFAKEKGNEKDLYGKFSENFMAQPPFRKILIASLAAFAVYKAFKWTFGKKEDGDGKMRGFKRLIGAIGLGAGAAIIASPMLKGTKVGNGIDDAYNGFFGKNVDSKFKLEPANMPLADLIRYEHEYGETAAMHELKSGMSLGLMPASTIANSYTIHEGGKNGTFTVGDHIKKQVELQTSSPAEQAVLLNNLQVDAPVWGEGLASIFYMIGVGSNRANKQTHGDISREAQLHGGDYDAITNTNFRLDYERIAREGKEYAANSNVSLGALINQMMQPVYFETPDPVFPIEPVDSTPIPAPSDAPVDSTPIPAPSDAPVDSTPIPAPSDAVKLEEIDTTVDIKDLSDVNPFLN